MTNTNSRTNNKTAVTTVFDRFTDINHKQALILNALEAPMTRDEVAEVLNIHPMTAWKYLTELTQLGYVQHIEGTFDQKYIYSLTDKAASVEEGKYEFKFYSKRMGKWLDKNHAWYEWFPGTHKQIAPLLIGILCHLNNRSKAIEDYNKNENLTLKDVEGIVAPPTPEECKVLLLWFIQYYESMIELLKNLREAPIWSDNFHEIMMPDIENVIELADNPDFPAMFLKFYHEGKFDRGMEIIKKKKKKLL